jgi:hypothetical protein
VEVLPAVGGAVEDLERPDFEEREDQVLNEGESVLETIFERDPSGAAPLTEAARELRAGISDEKLADLVLALYEENRLCIPPDAPEAHEPQIICSLAIAKTA